MIAYVYATGCIVILVSFFLVPKPVWRRWALVARLGRVNLMAPNMITLEGLLISILSWWMLSSGYILLAHWVNLFSFMFDKVDGWIARLFGGAPHEGKWRDQLNHLGFTWLGPRLDPFVDKLKTTPPLIYYAAAGHLSWSWVITLTLAEVVGTVMRFNMFSHWVSDVSATWVGKTKAVCIIITIVFLGFTDMSVDSWFTDQITLRSLQLATALAVANVFSRLNVIRRNPFVRELQKRN